MHQAELRLLHLHHVGAAGIEALPIDGDCTLQRTYLDAMQQQQFQQAAGQCRIVRVAEHEALHRLLCGLLQRALEELLLQVEQATTLGHCTTHRAQPGGDLVADGEREGQQAIHRFLHAATRTGLLDGDADRAVEVRIGRAVHRREVVEILAGVVQRTQGIQRLRVVLGQGLVELVRRRRNQRAVHALRRRLEVVRAVLAHFVEVDLHVRVPLVEHLHLRPRVLLGQGQPVAVEIGEVVVGAALRERLDVLLVSRVGRGRIGGPRVVPVGGAIATVRILRRVEQHHRLLQPLLGLGTAVGHQVVGGQHRRLGAGGLVAMHAVTQPHHHRAVARRTARLRRIDQGRVLLADLFQPRVVAGSGYRGDQQRAALVTATDLAHADLVRAFRQFLEVRHQLVVPGVTAADRVAEELLGCGNGRIERGRVDGLREEVRTLCLRWLRAGQCGGGGDQQRKNGTTMQGHGDSPGHNGRRSRGRLPEETGRSGWIRSGNRSPA